ncbi:MAG TPA: RodZ domain-containing protein [Rhodanobacteraceae bacterium]|nr:RodZ domain-containing protein [Rhodanobacteraceae bacterium]
MSHRKRKNTRAARPQTVATAPASAERIEEASRSTVDIEMPVAPVAEAAAVVESVLPAAATEEAPTATDAAAVACDHDNAIRIGERFQHARAKKNLSLGDAARRLRLPHRVLEKLESGDWHGIDSPLYLRGYLRSYSNLLEMDAPSVEPAAPAAPLSPPLVSTGGIPRSHYLWQRYTTAATYVGLTALVVVPMLLLGLHGGLKPDLTRLVPLDPPASSHVATDAQTVDKVAPVADQKPLSAPAVEEGAPLMASMAPVGLLDRELVTPAPVAVAVQPAADQTSRIRLHLDAPSWVEIHAADGQRVEYALLQAGDHQYNAAGTLDVRLGNSQNATIEVDGVARDMAAFRRANVAHFRIDAQGELKPAQG